MHILNISITLFLSLCGVGCDKNSPQKYPRLIGAQRATVGEIPWIVSLQREKTAGKLTHFCAGSIVDSTHICFWNKTNEAITVIAGALNISAAEDGQQRVKVSTVHLHPKYQSKNKAGPYDIAVLTLDTALTFNAIVTALALPDPEDKPNECMYAGWGNRFLISGLYYNPSEFLMTVRSRVISKFMCRARYLFVFGRQLDTALCTAAGPLRGSCQGDSGGSVTCYKSDDTPYLAGVVSWGWFICGDGIHPDVATDVSLFIDFIKSFLVIPQPDKVQHKL